MIFLYTDFGFAGPYVGELHAVFQRELPDFSVIDLMHDAPAFNPYAAGYLLDALSRRFEHGDACLAVVDPGVGSTTRRAILIVADNVVYCGPDNGLFSQIVSRASEVICHEIDWRPEELSDSFHARDLFAPALISYLRQTTLPLNPLEPHNVEGYSNPDFLSEVIYIDQFGNAILGIRADRINESEILTVSNKRLSYARTFSEVEKGRAFWHKNSMGLVEIAVNSGSARDVLDLHLGDIISFYKG